MTAPPPSCGCAECSERTWSKRNYGEGTSMPRYCRWKRKLYLISAMLSGFLLFTIYSFSFCCCVLVNSGLEQALQQRSRIIILDPDDPNRYEKDVADLSKAPHYKKLMRKTLLEDSDIQRSRRHSSAIALDDEDVYGIMPRTEEDELNGYTVDDHEDLDSEDDDPEYDGRTKSGQKSGLVRTKMRGSKKLPQALIIGVKKGGTRALLEFLRIHPDIRSPGPEPHFFDRHYARGLDWYRKQMPKTLDEQITIEKTPCYFVTKGVPGRVFNMSRDIKLIVVVRDPVTRAISDYTQAGSKRPDIRPFEEMAFIDNQAGLVDTSWGAIRIGVYAKHLERWLKYFPLSQMHFANGERLISDPVAELEKVQDFLGLKRVISDKHFYFNSTRGFPCLKKPEGSGNPHCLGKTKGRVHPDVDPKVIKRLRDFYRPFNAKFYQMTNIDFGWP